MTLIDAWFDLATISWYQLFFDTVPNRFLWSFCFGCDASQFWWMIFGRSYNFWFGIFDNILQFVLLTIVKGYKLLLVILGLFWSLWVTHVAYFNTFLQNLLHFFPHISCQHCWHIINDYKKIVIYEFFL
jgi:hypothetical protein